MTALWRRGRSPAWRRRASSRGRSDGRKRFGRSPAQSRSSHSVFYPGPVPLPALRKGLDVYLFLAGHDAAGGDCAPRRFVRLAGCISDQPRQRIGAPPVLADLRRRHDCHRIPVERRDRGRADTGRRRRGEDCTRRATRSLPSWSAPSSPMPHRSCCQSRTRPISSSTAITCRRCCNGCRAICCLQWFQSSPPIWRYGGRSAGCSAKPSPRMCRCRRSRAAAKPPPPALSRRRLCCSWPPPWTFTSGCRPVSPGLATAAIVLIPQTGSNVERTEGYFLGCAAAGRRPLRSGRGIKSDRCHRHDHCAASSSELRFRSAVDGMGRRHRCRHRQQSGQQPSGRSNRRQRGAKRSYRRSQLRAPS